MIQVRLFEEKDLDQAQKIIEQSVIEYTIDYKNMMVIEERGTLYGVSGYKLSNNDFDNPEAIMDLLIIDVQERMRMFGDSLIKATLNMMDRRGIKGVYVKACEDNKKFFEKVKLNLLENEVLDENIIRGLVVKPGEFVFKAQLPEFFNTACRSKGN